MDWNKMCSHDQAIARKLAAANGLTIDENGVVHKINEKVTVIACDDPDYVTIPES